MQSVGHPLVKDFKEGSSCNVVNFIRGDGDKSQIGLGEWEVREWRPHVDNSFCKVLPWWGPEKWGWAQGRCGVTVGLFRVGD